ncbi:MAG: hypothetical protein WD928_13875 [Gammaproteobacteria bacterium]
MRVIFSTVLGLLGMLTCAAVQAVAVVDFDTSVNWFNDATFTQVPGQAVSEVASLGNTFAVIKPGSTPAATSCAVVPEPSFSCMGSGPVRQVYDLTAATAPGSGVVASGVATAGNDAVSMTLSARSDGAVLGFTDLLLYNLVGIDRQRLRFDVAANALPEFIDVDITFTVQSAIDDNSIGVAGTYLAQASADVQVLEAATLVAPPFGTGTIHAPFVASAFVSNSGVASEAALTSVTETISVRPNAEYWVALESQVALSLVASPAFPVRDYAGLDIGLFAYADPVFALNADFAASRPDIAAALNIERITVVPLPPALLLFASAAGLLLARRRGKRDRGIKGPPGCLGAE